MPASAPADPPGSGLDCAAVRRELTECSVADKHLTQPKDAPSGGGRRGRGRHAALEALPPSLFPDGPAPHRPEHRMPEPARESRLCRGKAQPGEEQLTIQTKYPVVEFSREGWFCGWGFFCCFCLVLIFGFERVLPVSFGPRDRN